MLSPRWRKVVRDLWSNKARTLLVVLSISVGVFAVGSIVHMNIICTRDAAESYALVLPADAVLNLNSSFDHELLETVRRMDEVVAAEGLRSVTLRFKTSQSDQWYPIKLRAVADYENMTISKVAQEAEYAPDPENWRDGVFPPPDRQVVLERSSILTSMTGLVNPKLGDTIVIEVPGGKQREMRLAGLAYDFGNYPATFGGGALGFITPETMEWLGVEGGMNQLYLRVAESERTEAGIKRIADQVKDKVEKGGGIISYTDLRRPGELPAQYIFQAITLLLGMLGALALFLSVFLVLNTVSAHISQQIYQIGIMKAVGARPGQIATLYLGMVAIFGTLALVLAVPVAIYAAGWFTGFMAYFMNFKLQRFYIPSEVLALEIGLGLGVPLLAALLPILGGTNITVREALSHYGLGESKRRRVRKASLSLPFISRPLLITLRNTFRRKTRLLLTLVSLILAGTIFVGVFNIHAALSGTLESALKYFQSDMLVFLGKSYPRERVEAEAMTVPGVVRVEGWAGASMYRVRSDGTYSESAFMYGPPPLSSMINPTVVEGRWLLPEDENATVIGTELLRAEPDLKVGGEVVFKFNGRETNWRVVGIVRTVMMGQVAYANYNYLTHTLRDPDSAFLFVVVAERHDAASQNEIAKALDEQFRARGFQVGQAQTTESTRALIGMLFNILFALLMAMALLMAVVGGLGLMGTMALNVLERTREIGVMRAIGASNGAVRQMVIVEGVLIGILSWLAGVVLAVPLGNVMASTIGRAMFESPVDFAISVPGALLWLVLVVVIAVIASAVPAQNAIRLTVREVLAYE
jgi:putative ABC transport system permease protein